MVSWHTEMRLPCVVYILLHFLMVSNDSLFILAVKSCLMNAMLRVVTELVDSLMSGLMNGLRTVMHLFVARHKCCMAQLWHLVINMLRTMVFSS